MHRIPKNPTKRVYPIKHSFFPAGPEALNRIDGGKSCSGEPATFRRPCFAGDALVAYLHFPLLGFMRFARLMAWVLWEDGEHWCWAGRLVSIFQVLQDLPVRRPPSCGELVCHAVLTCRA